MSYADRLSRRVAAMGKPEDKGYRCLCCKDNGIIDRRIVNKYLLGTLASDPELQEEYSEMLVEGFDVLASVSSVPILCTRNDCRGNEVIIDTEKGRQRVERYNPEFLHHADPNHCQWIHEQELALMSKAERAIAPQVVHDAIASAGIAQGGEG